MSKIKYLKAALVLAVGATINAEITVVLSALAGFLYYLDKTNSGAA